ncbi:hypothetical protein TcCL_ESM03722 [Trypanosoma cruzi]|nr:hypothetical protein TcCL_ESM03722 [Trypanosoma cruzi]
MNRPKSVVSLLAEAAAGCQHRLSSCRAAEFCRAAIALHLRCGVAVHNGDGVAPRALHVHEVRVGSLHQAAALVLHALRAHRRVTEIGVKESHRFADLQS